jgi:hypothetical protein
MKKLLIMILVLSCCMGARADVLSNSQIEVERTALFQSCVAKYRPGIAYTQEGFTTFCRCAAVRFFQDLPVDVAESLQRGDVMSQSVQLHRNRIGQYCTEWVQNRQLSLLPGTLLVYTPDEAGRISNPSPKPPSPNYPPPQERSSSIDGSICSTDPGGLIRCNNGLTCTRDAGGLVRCNNGLSFNTDKGGLTRFNNGATAITDKGGMTRYSDGTTSYTDRSGFTRFSDGTNCTRDALGLIQCSKGRVLLD